MAATSADRETLRAEEEALRAASPALALALIAGLAAGLVRGGHYVAAGFPSMLAASIARELDWALAGAALFALLYGLLRRALRGRPGRWAVALAVALAGAPVLAVAGYRLNRTVGIRPSELFAAYPLKLNLALVAGGALAALVLWWRLARAARRDDEGGAAARGASWAAGIALGALLLAHAAVWTSLASGSRPAATASRPDVLILLVDALRADHVGAYGYPRATTPAIDSLAADGVVFRQAVSDSTFTKSSISSLFTGRYPYQHGVYWGSRTDDPEFPGAVTSDVLPARETTLAEALRPLGYFTAAWVQNSHLRGFMGFGQGFVDYHDQQGSAPRIDRRFLSWFERAGRRYPFFAYLHYIDLHDPYRPAPPYDTMFGTYGDPYRGIDFAEWGRFLAAVRRGEATLTRPQVEQLEAFYDGQLRLVDDQVGRLLARLKRAGVYDRSLILVTADHGDGFMEHGFISHSTTPYDELVRVPLIVKLPGGRDAGRVVARQVRLVDVLPTVVDLVGGRVPPDVAGCSLRPLLEGAGGERPAACSTAVIEIAEPGTEEPTVAVRTEGWKYIHRGDGREELYDLAADPGEHHDLLPQPPPAARSALERLRAVARHAIAARDTQDVGKVKLDPDAVRELKALGYVQ